MPQLTAKLRLSCLFMALMIGTIVLPAAHGSNASQGRMVVNIGGLGAWDGFSVFRPFVLYNGSSYMMWYSGESVYVIDYIGFANRLTAFYGHDIRKTRF